MTVYNALIRAALADKGMAYLPYVFVGNWTDQEKLVVQAAIDPHVPVKVYATFNNWIFTKQSFGVMARKASWTEPWLLDTAGQLADRISKYYEHFEGC